MSDRIRAVEIVVDTLPAIQNLTRVGPDNAHDALLMIHAIVETLQEGLDGKTSPEVVQAEIAAILSDQTAATSDIQDKFDPGGES